MEPQLRVESQRRLPRHDQEQLIEGRDRRGKLASIAEHTVPIDDTADPLHGERALGRCRRNHVADPVDPRDADRPELPSACR